MHSRLVILVLALLAVVASGMTPRATASTDSPQPLPIADWKGKRVLMVSAHPDDIEAAAGGTIAKLTAQGTEVEFFIYTNGDKGCSNPLCVNMSSAEIAALRAVEAVNAALWLGVPASHVKILEYPDSLLSAVPYNELRTRLVAEVRRFKPHIMMAWYPYPRFDLAPKDGWMDLGFHVDHQESGRIALATASSSQVGRLYPFAGEAWGLEAFYLWEFGQPSHYVDIGETMGQKVASFLAHKSQVPDQALVRPTLERLAASVANNTKGFKGKYAEGFLAFH